MIREIPLRPVAGIPVVIGLVVAQVAPLALVAGAVLTRFPPYIVGAALLAAFVGFLFAGLFMVSPNEAKVLQLFGSYVGSAREPGLRWANPFYTKKRISLRVRNFESAT
jgi:nucleoside recognition membrane protein YjiH